MVGAEVVVVVESSIGSEVFDATIGSVTSFSILLFISLSSIKVVEDNIVVVSITSDLTVDVFIVLVLCLVSSV
jgi:hypothetical protein